MGDNVGDCAGMAADLFESYEVTLVASIILGVAAFQSIGAQPRARASIFPLAARAIGVLASIVGVFAVRATDKDKSAMAPINRGFLTAGLLTVIGTAVVAFVYVGNDNVRRRLAVLRRGRRRSRARAGRSAASPSTSRRPRPRRCARSPRRPAPARPPSVLSGISSGLESWSTPSSPSRWRSASRIALGDGNIQFSFYLVALTGMGMLATTGVVVSEDTFGPVADNAAGIAEMSGEFEGEPERIMVSLDAVGNTTKAVTKGFAIGSAVIAVGRAVRLVHRDHRRASSTRSRASPATELFNNIAHADQRRQPEGVHRPAHRRLGRVPVLGARDPRRRPHRRRRRAGGPAASSPTAGSWPATKKPDYGPVIDICTAASLRELATPALLAVLTPVIIGFGINYFALGAFLAGVILTGQLMANFLSQLRWRVGQRQEVHRGRQRGRQGLRGPQGRRHRRHRRRPVQGHRRSRR